MPIRAAGHLSLPSLQLRGPWSASSPRQSGGAREKGTALIEFTFVLPILLLMVFALIEFGHVIQSRLVVANISREGGSIASRELTVDPDLVDMLAASSRPLILDGADGKIIITRVKAGISGSTAPKIASQHFAGSLGLGPSIATGRSNLGLPANLYNHLVYKSANSTADVTEITVVEVYYRYRPITPTPWLFPGLGLTADGGGMFMSSTAIF